MTSSPLSIIHRSKAVVLSLFIISGVINLLALSGALYMLQVYDRVLTSHNMETLIALSMLVAGLYAVLGILDVLRSQILLRLGANFNAEMMPRAYRAAARAALATSCAPNSVEPVRDVDNVRAFLAGLAPVAIFDLPWSPIFLVFVWLLSPELGLVTACGLAGLLAFAWITDLATRKLESKVQAAALDRAHMLDAALRNSEAATAMGFASDLGHRFLNANSRQCEAQTKSSDIVSALASLSKVFRLMLQSAILGLGAYYAVQGDISIGAIMAASIASARALAPAEQAIANWRTLVTARRSYRQLMATLASEGVPTPRIELPAPKERLDAEKVSVLAQSARRLIIKGASLNLTAGKCLAIIGRSGSGKSTLAKSLIGLVPVAQGIIRLDGVPIERWDATDRGHFIGFMPQQIEIFPGTVAENIARLEENPPSDAVLAAAIAAGIHEIILELTDGYETVIGPGGFQLSAGQRQQIGLARALYGNPFLIVLDEPNANLDADAERALISALRAAKERGAIVIVVAHRRSLLSACELVAVMDDGQITAFGPKTEVLEEPVRTVRSGRPAPSAPQTNEIEKSRRTNAQ